MKRICSIYKGFDSLSTRRPENEMDVTLKVTTESRFTTFKLLGVFISSDLCKGCFGSLICLNKLCVIIPRRSSQRSTALLRNDSVYERAGNNILNSVFVHTQYLLTDFFRQTRIPNRTCIFKNRTNYRGINTHNVRCR